MTSYRVQQADGTGVVSLLFDAWTHEACFDSEVLLTVLDLRMFLFVCFL